MILKEWRVFSVSVLSCPLVDLHLFLPVTLFRGDLQNTTEHTHDHCTTRMIPPDFSIPTIKKQDLAKMLLLHRTTYHIIRSFSLHRNQKT